MWMCVCVRACMHACMYVHMYVCMTQIWRWFVVIKEMLHLIIRNKAPLGQSYWNVQEEPRMMQPYNGSISLCWSQLGLLLCENQNVTFCSVCQNIWAFKKLFIGSKPCYSDYDVSLWWKTEYISWTEYLYIMVYRFRIGNASSSLRFIYNSIRNIINTIALIIKEILFHI